jgi:hypothetical protein
MRRFICVTVSGYKEAAEMLRQHGGQEYGYSPIALRLGLTFLLLLAAALYVLSLILHRLKRIYMKNYYRYAISLLAVTTAFVVTNICYFPRLATFDYYSNAYGGPFPFCWETEYYIGILPNIFASTIFHKHLFVLLSNRFSQGCSAGIGRF